MPSFRANKAAAGRFCSVFRCITDQFHGTTTDGRRGVNQCSHRSRRHSLIDPHDLLAGRVTVSRTASAANNCDAENAPIHTPRPLIHTDTFIHAHTHARTQPCGRAHTHRETDTSRAVDRYALPSSE